MKSVIGILSLAAGVVAAPCARAQDIPGYPAIEAFDSREVAMLPRYCRHTIYFRDKVPGGANADDVARWRSFFGPTFDALHHYCFGIMKTNRAVLLARNPQVKQFYLQESIREFNYVLDRAPPEFVLLPEILTKKGENLLRLDRAPAAVVELERAAAIKPDFWPAYAHLGDYYARVGESAKARETFERGLQAAPQSAPLKRRLDELARKAGNRASKP